MRHVTFASALRPPTAEMLLGRKNRMKLDQEVDKVAKRSRRTVPPCLLDEKTKRKFRPRFKLTESYAKPHEERDGRGCKDARRFLPKPCFEGCVDVELITFLLCYLDTKSSGRGIVTLRIHHSSNKSLAFDWNNTTVSPTSGDNRPSRGDTEMS